MFSLLFQHLSLHFLTVKRNQKVKKKVKSTLPDKSGKL